MPLTTRDFRFGTSSWTSFLGRLCSLSWEPTHRKVGELSQIKFTLHSFHLPLPGKITSLIYHWFAVYLLIGLLSDILLHAIGLWNYYNSHSEPVLNKLLAKANQPLSFICHSPNKNRDRQIQNAEPLNWDRDLILGAWDRCDVQAGCTGCWAGLMRRRKSWKVFETHLFF